jgi:ribose transport system ATP-binding protein
MLGREERRFGLVARKAARARVKEALAFLGHEDLAPTASVASLGPGARQVVEIARALVFDAKLVVMDEPTSSLSKKDTERLFGAVSRLRERGVSIIYISHFLEELEVIADRYTVLRDGATVGTGQMAEASIAALVELMVGRSVDEIFPRVPHERGEPLLALDSVFGAKLPRGASLVLHRGEILGIGGLVGAGRTELLRAVFGLDPVKSGKVTIAKVTDHGRPPHHRVAQGVGLLSEDRKGEGLALSLSIAENATLSKLSSVSRFGVVDRRARTTATKALVDELRVKCSSESQRVGDLSGGNQQKVAFARLLHQNADVLLLDEPTRGVDVGSKAEIYALIGELAARGKAILLVSSYVPELLGICDRIAVMHRGELLPARPRDAWTDASILEAAALGEGGAA